MRTAAAKGAADVPAVSPAVHAPVAQRTQAGRGTHGARSAGGRGARFGAGTGTPVKEEAEVSVDAKWAAGFLGVSIDTVYRYADRGELPGFRIGRSWRFLRADLAEWVKKETRRGMVKTLHAAK